MRNKELIEEISARTNIDKKDVDLIITGFLDTLTANLHKGEKVILLNFGTFFIRHNKGRISTFTNKFIQPKNYPAFKPSVKFKWYINKLHKSIK